MDTSKIIIGTVGGGRYTVTSPIVKEDYGLYLKIEGLELPSTYEVDFSNSEHNGTSVTMIGNADGVLIPSQFISTGKDVFAFLYHVGSDYGRTVYKFRIPNKLRPDRTDETPTPEEQSVIDQAISALNSAVAQTAQDVIDADASQRMALGYAESAQESARQAQEYSTVAISNANSASQSASQASASATASAQSASQSAQIKADVEDLAEEAQASASASAQSATASANSASQASGYAQSASASAQSASGYASSAETSAQSASTKASEASTSASTASAKATESAQSASQAQGYANTAESAKTSAQTAQGLAESARDSAISAKDDAESARDTAQTLVDGISGKVEQIDSNTERIESLEDDRYKPYVVDSASGSIASFPDGAEDIPLKSLVVDINPVQDLSQGDPSPTNICPISGWTEVDVEQSGVNVWDEEWEVGGIGSSTGNNELANDRIRTTGYIEIKPSAEYYCSIPSGAVFAFFYDADKTFISPRIGASNRTFTTPSNARYMRFHTYTYGNTYNHDISINYPSTDHSYHPYTGRSITIQLGQTVYGGKLDVLSGVMKVGMTVVDLGTLSWLYSSGTQRMYSISLVSVIKKPASDAVTANALCSVYDTTSANATTMHVKDKIISIGSTGVISVYDTDYVGVAPSEFKTAMSGVQLCYELAEPIEIQLDAHTLNSLYGQNNIFADTGDCSVEYRADTTLYISRLTEPDADMIADSNIVSGQYFMVGNSLFKATANIASDSAVIVGTNCTRKSLSEALNEINS